ncbi:4745_t:CDS:1, partial [Rhizophagus irregularis]
FKALIITISIYATSWYINGTLILKEEKERYTVFKPELLKIFS